jgi:uncharacterized protein (DUF433 family)
MTTTSERLAEEQQRMRRVPGIFFWDNLGERRAVIDGTGIEVWELVMIWRDMDWDEAALREYFENLEPWQIDGALGYYRLHKAEVDLLIRLNDEFDIEAFWRENPSTRPPGR